MIALAPTPPRASTAAMPIMNRRGRYGFVIGVLSREGRRVDNSSCGGRHPGEAGDDPVDDVAAPGLVAVGQELEREAHDERARQAVPGAHPHDLGVLDDPHEPP